MEQVYIGTSGWVYKEWAKSFYRGLSAKDQLPFYLTQFPTVEINASFYRLPTLKTIHAWREQAPDGFVFAVKGSRFITHIKRLHDLGPTVNKFMRRIGPLMPRLGPLLWQLPPTLKMDLPRLRQFLKKLPPRFLHAVEFRHPSWLEPATMELLRSFKACSVSVSSMRMPMDLSVTADFIYIRFHGLSGGPRHDYTKEELAPWVEHIRNQSRAGKRVFAYFNNDLNVRAPDNAKLLRELCG
jgi:uncharacterized protein YecE (DUF72 family)